MNLGSPSFGASIQAQYSKKISLKIKERTSVTVNAPLLTASSKLLFVLLPFIVIAMHLGYKGQLNSLFSLPEWSIVSAVLAGQSFVTLTATNQGRFFANRELAMLLVSALLVVVLIPVLILMSIVLTSATVSPLLAICQCIFFMLSLVIFFLASLAHSAAEAERV